MPILKILPDAVDSTANYVFGNVTTNSLTVGGTNVQSVLIINQGIDATQNTRLNAIETINTDQNTSISIIQGVDATQNTNITIADTKAQAAFDKANAANSLAQAAYNQANTGLDQYARDTANSASANTIIIQGVDSTQNTNITIIQGVDTWQNTQITNINSLAQGAFNKANTGARATASNTAPTGNTVGDLWLSLTDETLYMYSYDGVSNNWIDISGPILISTNIVVQYTITANVI